MQGTVKWFNSQKGYGFITDGEGNDVFVYYGNIVMDGYKALDECDVVEFELGSRDDGRTQAINVKPILTVKIIKDALKKEGLYVNGFRDAYGAELFRVVDSNNVLQTSEQGISFQELAEYAGLDVEGLF